MIPNLPIVVHCVDFIAVRITITNIENNKVVMYSLDLSLYSPRLLGDTGPV